MELKKIGEHIKVARNRRKMTVTELSVKSDVSRMTIGRIEKGDPTVGVGKLGNVLSALGLLRGLSELVDPTLDRAQAIREIKHWREGKDPKTAPKRIIRTIMVGQNDE